MRDQAKIVAASIVVLAIGAITVSGCGSPSGSRASHARLKADSTTNVEVGEMYIHPSAARLQAGNVKLVVKNVGKVVHEVVVLKTGTPAGRLVVTDGRVSEKDSVGEVGDIAAGSTKSGVIKLVPGTYVLVCNVPGHYSGGMRAALTVT